MDKLIFCENCLEYVKYSVINSVSKQIYKGNEYVYHTKECLCDRCGGYLYVPELNDYNINQWIKVYRSKDMARENMLLDNLDKIRITLYINNVEKSYQLSEQDIELVKKYMRAVDDSNLVTTITYLYVTNKVDFILSEVEDNQANEVLITKYDLEECKRFIDLSTYDWNNVG